MTKRSRRRNWSDDEKRMICGQTRVRGVSVSQVARRLLKQHQADDRNAVGAACLAALEQWAEGHGARDRVRTLRQGLA